MPHGLPPILRWSPLNVLCNFSFKWLHTTYSKVKSVSDGPQGMRSQLIE